MTLLKPLILKPWNSCAFLFTTSPRSWDVVDCNDKFVRTIVDSKKSANFFSCLNSTSYRLLTSYFTSSVKYLNTSINALTDFYLTVNCKQPVLAMHQCHAPMPPVKEPATRPKTKRQQPQRTDRGHQSSALKSVRTWRKKARNYGSASQLKSSILLNFQTTHP